MSINDDYFQPASDGPSVDPVDVTRPLQPRLVRLVPLPAWTLCTPTPADASVVAVDPAWLEFLGVDAPAGDPPSGNPWLELLPR